MREGEGGEEGRRGRKGGEGGRRGRCSLAVHMSIHCFVCRNYEQIARVHQSAVSGSLTSGRAHY